MKIAVPIIVFLLIALLIGVKLRSQNSTTGTKTEAGQKLPAASKDVYLGLRNTMLQSPRSKFGLVPTSAPTEPWGVLMDWGVEHGTATVVAASDGSASVYFSSGGGYIGGRGQEPIRRAAQKAVEVAKAVQPMAHSTTTFPLAERGGVVFYLLTDSGVFTTDATERDLNSASHPLRPLGDAMQEVITQYRLWSEEQKNSAAK
jgi:hypothetical protein